MKLKSEFTIECRSGNKKSDTIYIKNEDKIIGYLAMVFDEDSKIYDGILVLHKYLEREDIFKIGQMIQHELLTSDEEMFIETYFGVKFGMMCDETPTNWDRMLKK